MGSKGKLLAASALAAGAALFAACRADDTAGNSHAASDSGATHAAAKPTAQQQPAPAEDARRVTVDELRKMLDAGDTVVYDTRAKEAYEQEHIKGSLSMPFNEVDARSGELPKGKSLVFYCT
jgi:3-mercaptopyruvate sulfurtransferase SseA